MGKPLVWWCWGGGDGATTSSAPWGVALERGRGGPLQPLGAHGAGALQKCVWGGGVKERVPRECARVGVGDGVNRNMNESSMFQNGPRALREARASPPLPPPPAKVPTRPLFLLGLWGEKIHTRMHAETPSPPQRPSAHTVQPCGGHCNPNPNLTRWASRAEQRERAAVLSSSLNHAPARPRPLSSFPLALGCLALQPHTLTASCGAPCFGGGGGGLAEKASKVCKPPHHMGQPRLVATHASHPTRLHPPTAQGTDTGKPSCCSNGRGDRRRGRRGPAATGHDAATAGLGGAERGASGGPGGHHCGVCGGQGKDWTGGQ